MKSDARNVCETLVVEAQCIASAHVVDEDGGVLVSIGRAVDDRSSAEVSRLGRQVARADRPRSCMCSDMVDGVCCLAMTIVTGQALVVVFFADHTSARVPQIMARAVARLRHYVPDVPPDSGNGGTPNEARVWVSARDFDVN